MKKFFVILPAVILMSACTSTTNVTHKSGIDYAKYRNTEPVADNVFTGTLPPAEGAATAAPGAGDDFVGESRYNTKSAYGDAVVTVGTKKFSLSPKAGANDMRAFQSSVDRAYLAAKRAYNPAGFTYSLSPAGPVNPLSDMEVQCILSQESADNVGQKTCDLFFKSLKSDYAASAGAPSNAGI